MSKASTLYCIALCVNKRLEPMTLPKNNGEKRVKSVEKI